MTCALLVRVDYRDIASSSSLTLASEQEKKISEIRYQKQQELARLSRCESSTSNPEVVSADGLNVGKSNIE